MGKKASLLLFVLVLLLVLAVKPLYAQSASSPCVITRVGTPLSPVPTCASSNTSPGSGGARKDFVYYCQGNSQWMNTCSLGAGGCGPTSMAMVFSTFGVTKTPPEMDQMFQEQGFRTCSDAGSFMTLALTNSWIKNQGFTVGPNLVNGTSLDTALAKKAFDDGNLIIASSHAYPCAWGNCKDPNGTVDHIFVVDGINEANGTVSIRDPFNCTYMDGNVERQDPNHPYTSFPWAYAYPIKKTN